MNLNKHYQSVSFFNQQPMNPIPKDSRFATVESIVCEVFNGAVLSKNIKARYAFIGAVKIYDKKLYKRLGDDLFNTSSGTVGQWHRKHKELMKLDHEYMINFSIIRHRLLKVVKQTKLTPEMINQYYELKELIEPNYNKKQTDPSQCEIKSHNACKCGEHCMWGKKRNLNE